MRPGLTTIYLSAKIYAGAMTTALAGTHHVSALTAHIERSHAFHTHVLGLRPLLRTVNQDDPGMYHLFYGDGAGTAGTELTLFDLPRALPERAGNQSITLTTLQVSGESSLEYWAARLRAHDVAHEGIRERGGRAVLDFADPEGMRLSLVAAAGASDAVAWEASPVPVEHQLRGLGYVLLTVSEREPTERFLVDALGLLVERAYAHEDHEVHVYRMTPGVAGEVHVAVRPELARARYGAGGVHHVALTVPGGAAQLAPWADRLDALRYRHSGIVDRHYFTSLYVREPNHVLFELATSLPGLQVDGPLDGERLSLPPFLEPRRPEIEAKLKPLGRAAPA